MIFSRLITGVAMPGSTKRMSWSWPSIRYRTRRPFSCGSKWISVAWESQARSRIVVDQLRQGRRDRLLLQLLADVAVLLAAVGGERAGGDGRHRGPGRDGLAVVARQRGEALERQLIEEFGRDQIQLEDRLPQVAIVLLAVQLAPRRPAPSRAALS